MLLTAPSGKIVTYDIVMDLSVRQYRGNGGTDLVQQYRCVVIIVILTNQLHVCTTRLRDRNAQCPLISSCSVGRCTCM